MLILEQVLFIGLVLFCFSFLKLLAHKQNWPYTVILLLFGLVAKTLFKFIGITTHLELSSDITYYLILPILLFGSALHLNFHQFRLQFKTISFLATFGLLLSVGSIGVLLSLILGWELRTALLFGALISATDPIAVLALFKNIGGPRRLALLADGESMINDATAVILFRILTAVAVGNEVFSHNTLLFSVGEFSYVFFGSLTLGAIYGYAISWMLAKIENNLIVETTLTLGAALLVFTAAEHFLALSGVISSVVAGLFVGNLGRSRISPQVTHFVHELWDYFGFLSISFVFFFATYHLRLNFLLDYFPTWLWVVAITFVARAVAIYGSIAISNRSSFFKNEPNIPLAWQHVLNLGGLRGVIPLVLVFSLPDSYVYKEMIFNFTFASLLFTLIINGSLISILIKKLKLNLPSNSEQIRQLYHSLFDLEAAIRKVRSSQIIAVSRLEIEKKIQDWTRQENFILSQLNQSPADNYCDALALQAISIERSVYEKLLEREEISEAAFYQLDVQLDIQADAIEYPQLAIRNVDRRGRLKSSKLFRQRALELRALMSKYPIFCRIFKIEQSQLFLERCMILSSRQIGSKRVLNFLCALLSKTTNPILQKNSQDLFANYQNYYNAAKKELFNLKKEVDLSEYKQQVLDHALVHQHSPWENI